MNKAMHDAASRSDLELMLTVERARGPNRRASRRQRRRWERDLWSAYVLDGPGRLGGVANERPNDVA